MTSADLSCRLAIPRSSAYCLLLTLERRGYLHRNDGTGRFICYSKLVHLSPRLLLVRSGFGASGAPIFDHSGQVIAAIGIAGTISQITADNFFEVASRTRLD
ncbi:MAG: helix-turn-helix domain-containing protein [Vicinamibacteraceae bacterium]